ncbi:MAG: FAD-binding oxidoreductase [Candidatus Geothermincolia bacterium]
MDLKEVFYTAADLGWAGVVLSKKLYSHLLADPLDFEPSLVADTVARLHVDRLPVTVSEIIDETASSKTFRLRAADGTLPSYRSGQFVTVFLAIDGIKTSRAYSISSSPTRLGYLDITVRRVADGFVSAYLLDRAQVGDVLEIAGPAGCFYYEPYMDGDDLVFLAGGSGITPFMSMIRHAVDTGSSTRMHLVYGSRTPEDVIFGAELEQLAERYENIRFDLVISEPPKGYKGVCGFLDDSVMKEVVGDTEGKTFFACGPTAMYDLCADSLGKLGVPPARLRQEISGPPPQITAVSGWPVALTGEEMFTVTLDGCGRAVSVRSGEPLMNALEREGVTIGNLCRSGECGICRTRLLSGDVFMPGTVTMRAMDAACGYIHPCMSYALSDLVIRL